MKNSRKLISLLIVCLVVVALTSIGNIQAEASNVYIVKKGDSLWRLSRQFNVSIESIKEANNHWSDTIYIDQRLIIPSEDLRVSTSRSAVARVTNTDIELIARTVHGEARGESFEGQVAVAAVILNRLRSNEFPNTVHGVVYQPRAFTVVDDGQINLMPNQSSFNAVEEALRGWDPSDGALYYFNPETATSRWIWSRSQIKQIGNHVFAR
jgi:N-acetylmuramoyl-L-alanine amidase